jgi:release factor glutamine methyltransferase
MDLTAPVPLTETVDFGGMSIAFDSRLLRPRDWTAAQSRWAAELAVEVPTGRILELCCGAGQIGLLAAQLSGRSLVCVDASPVAAAYTRDNARAAGLEGAVEVREGLLTEVLEPDETFPLVVADPPWVPRADTGRFPEDPLLAIDGGADGLDLARACVATIGAHLAPGGLAVLQLGTTDQVARLHAALAGAGLRVAEVRGYEDRGVVVRLER